MYHIGFSSNEYLTLTSTEYLIHRKHYLKIFCKFKHFSQRYKRKRKLVFFLNTMYSQNIEATCGADPS